MNQIITATAAAFELDAAELVGPSRARHIVAARAGAAWALRRRWPDLSLAAIAGALGRRDHTTAMNLLDYAEDRAASDHHYAARLRAIEEGQTMTRAKDIPIVPLGELLATLGAPVNLAERTLIMRVTSALEQVEHWIGKSAFADSDAERRQYESQAAIARTEARAIAYAVALYREEAQHA